jgi:hypothetical protein
MARYTLHTEPTFQGLPVQARPDRPCRSDILESLAQLFEATVPSRHKTFFLRFDLRFPTNPYYPPDNSFFQTFIDSFAKHLRREGYAPGYFWVREGGSKSPGDHHHYHLVLLLDGRKTQSIFGHLAIAERMWALALGIPEAAGLVNYCLKDRDGNPQQNGIMIRRDDPNWRDAYATCFHWASYLGKCTGKGEAPKSVREFGCSQIPRTAANDIRSACLELSLS